MVWLLLEIYFTLRKGRAELYFLKYKCTPNRYITVPFLASQLLYPSPRKYPSAQNAPINNGRITGQNWENQHATLLFSIFFFHMMWTLVRDPCTAVLVSVNSHWGGCIQEQQCRQSIQLLVLRQGSHSGFPPINTAYCVQWGQVGLTLGLGGWMPFITWEPQSVCYLNCSSCTWSSRWIGIHAKLS